MVVINMNPWGWKSETPQAAEEDDVTDADKTVQNSPPINLEEELKLGEEEIKLELSETESRPALFGFQDLASDYYQVLREHGRPRRCKIVWGFLIFGLILFTFYMVYRLLYDFFQYNSYSTSSTYWVDNITLPAISVCSTNFINYTAMKVDYKGTDELSQFEAALEDLENFQISGQGSLVDAIDEDSFQALSALEKSSGSINVNYQNDFESMLVGLYPYSFEKTGQSIADFTEYVYPTEIGSCFEINDDGVLQQSIAGIKGGFSIDIDANINDYIFTTETKGFKIFLRNQDETVMLDSGGIVIRPGSETFLALDGKSLSRLGEPYGTCENVESQYTKHGEVRYESVGECEQRQKIDDLMIQKCKCIPWYLGYRLYMLNRTDLLDEAVEYLQQFKNVTSTARGGIGPYLSYLCTFVNQAICDSQVDSWIQNADDGVELEHCPEPCDYNEWDVVISSTIFPSTEEYYEKFIQSGITGKPSFAYARSNIARIHIYYEDIKYERVEQEQAYEIQNFIAEFGGTVDLFIGFSFFTVFQLIEIGIAACVFKCCR